KQGEVKEGDEFVYEPRVIKTKIITLSDRAFEGIYKDKSGKIIEQRVKDFWDNNGRLSEINYTLIPDNEEKLKAAINEAVNSNFDFIFTTGGTGIGPKDITPDVVKPMFDKEIPGIMDLIRMKYGAEKPAALISRSVAGLIGKSLVYCLPGSTKAVNEYMDEILKTVEHSLYMIHQLDLH
ncbi:MAG: molybdenum cofactor synthesis protein, partial [Marinilabiliales bacterium]